MRNSDPHDAPHGAPNGALERLRHALQQALGGRPKGAGALFPKGADARLLAAIQAIGPARGHRHPPHVAHGVMAFRLRGPETPAPELKYACYGIARQVDWDGRRLIDEPRRVADLLASVAALAALPADAHGLPRLLPRPARRLAGKRRRTRSRGSSRRRRPLAGRRRIPARTGPALTIPNGTARDGAPTATPNLARINAPGATLHGEQARTPLAKGCSPRAGKS